MSRLIDADELTELVNWTFAKPPFSRKTILHMIDMARRVDAVPVIHGKWISHWDCGVTECSCCGWNIEDFVGWNYCPNCGAKMEVEHD